MTREEKLEQMLIDEKEKSKAARELMGVYCAYITILLQKLGATKDNMVSITGPEIKEVMEKYETRAVYDGENKVYSLYCEDRGNGDGVQSEATAVEGEKTNQPEGSV